MKPSDYRARNQAATDLDTTLFVEAAAGTGKTTALVSRILSAVSVGRARLHEIVAITFTEKAAGELKIRLREELESKLSGEKLREALRDLERAPITTIHSFCASILRERPVEAAVDPQFAVADEMQRELLLDEAWTQWFEAELSKNPVGLREALVREVRPDDLRALAVLLVEHRSQLAGAHWPARRAVRTQNVLKRLGEIAGTLDAALKHCVARPENFYQRAQTFCETLPLLKHSSVERVAAVLGALELSEPKRITDFDSEDAFREAKKAVKELKAELKEFVASAEHNFLVELVGWLEGFIASFQQFKRGKAILDFDDLLEKARELLRDRPDVRRGLQQRYRYLLVDEFQDTDPVQVEIILALAGDQPGKLFIVGDPKQSIYGFRRADIEMYAATRRELETAGRVLQFQQNFRSQSTILDWVNETFKELIKKPADGDYQPDYIELKPTFMMDEPRVTVLRPKEFAEKIQDVRYAEATAAARWLRQEVAAGKFEWGEVALLFRSFTGMEVFEDVFVTEGVPFRVIGGKGYYQRQEIQTLVSLLCCLDNPNDKLNLVAVLRSPLFGWSDEQIFLAAAGDQLDYLRNDSLALLRELHEQRHALSVAGYTELVFARTHICQAFFACGPDGTASVANLLKALDLARSLEAAGVRSLRGFVRHLRTTVLEEVDEEPAPSTEENADAAQFLTMHKSKGLQFPVVVLADLAGKSSDRGVRLVVNRANRTFELRFAGCRTTEFDAAVTAQDSRDEAEEIRLLYVAATRAQERLVIPWFKEKGERLDLLSKGFKPVAGPLVELPDIESLSAGAVERPSLKTSAGSLIQKRRVWLSERKELLTKASMPPVRVSPSRLAGESESSEEEPAGTERTQAMDFGLVVHDALEQMSAGVIATSKLSDDEKRRATDIVDKTLKSELLARVGNADEVYRELPFTLPTDKGSMEGKVDLLFREGRRWVLVDYKTDARVEPERYVEQLRAYEAALKQIAGITVAEKLLFFLSSGTVKAVN